MEKTIKYLENGEYHYATVRSVGDLAQLKTTSKETLVEAINELWNGGGNVDPSKVPNPEGYDKLLQDVADAVKNQQEISQQWIEWQKEDTQLTEERKQAYLQAMKEMQESIDKAKADAATLDDKTAKLDEQITKTFSDLDTNIQNMHEQLQKEADRMNQELQDTKGALSTLRTDLQNAQLDNGRIHDELTNINGKFEHKVWQTDLDPLKAQIDRAETSVQQTKDELLGKASRQDLDTVSNTVSKLDTQLKETAKGVEISVKKDELGGEIAEALTNKTNILLGTRRFTTNNWQQREHVEMCSDPWKGFLVAKQNSPIEGIQQAYDVKAGTTYTFSLFAKMDTLDDSNKPQIILAKTNLDTSLDTKIDAWRKEIEDITSDFKRYDLTFTPSEDCTIYPHVISNSNNPIFVCGYQLEIGKTSTPWEPNQEDVGDYVEKSEAQFNVYNDKIQALTEKQRQQGDTQEKLRTEVTQTAEGTRQVSENLKKTNDDITKLRGEFEVKADHMKSEYETYTNKAVGQISDSTLNLIRNSSFQNKDSDFDQWQNVSAKANVRQDENGLRWVELTQSGMTTDNIVGLTSNYFKVKQGKVTVAVDIKSGTKADLDVESVLTLELYDENKKRVDFTRLTLNDLGLNKSLLGDHQVHRGLHRLGIDRNDAKYMTVKALLARNGDLYFTNFSARLSSIDDGAYEPNPDDISQQILKQNTKIEQNAKEVAIKANSVDVTRDIKDAVNGIQVGGTNLANKTNQGIANWMCDPGNGETNLTEININGVRGVRFNNTKKTTNWWVAKYALDLNKYEPNTDYVISFDIRASANVAPGGMLTIAGGDGGHRYFTDGSFGQQLNANQLTHVSLVKHTNENLDKENYESFYLNQYELGQCDWVDFVNLKIEKGNKGTAWSSAPQDTSDEIKSAKDAAIQVASDQINLHVNEISTQFDDKLNKRINEQKTASEKFTSDGIEQVVTKIKNVKGDVDRLGDTVGNLEVGGRNLVTGTDKDIVIDDTGNTGTQGWCFTIIHLTQQPKVGDKITVSAESTLTGKGHLDDYTVLLYNDTTTNPRSSQGRLKPGRRSSATITVDNLNGSGDTVLLIYAGNPSDTQGKKNVVHHLKVERGNKATDWTQAPEDINQTIKDATEYKTVTGTIDFNNLKTQQKIFYKDLQATNTPAGGNYWYYLDVEPGTDGRIFQTAISDRDNITWVRTFADGWGSWIRQADQRNVDDLNNQISSFKTETTASVKNLGDRVTTQVNSITTRQNNFENETKAQHSNDVELVRKSDFEDGSKGNWTVTGVVPATNPAPPAELGQSGMKVLQTNTRDGYEDGIWYSVKPGEKFDVDYWCAPSPAFHTTFGLCFVDKNKGNWNWQGIQTDQSGQWKHYTGTITAPANASFARPWYQMDKPANNTENSSWIAKPHIRRQNPATIEAIKTLNTKWDVANGQIQGKVTESQVNNILNSKGYATQSWAQSNFRMKSDSISLEVKEITDPISNRVNNVNSKLDNLQVGGTNLANKTNQGTINWTCDPGNGTTNLTEININGNRGVRFNNTNKTTSWWVVKYALDLNKFEPTTDYVISFDIRTPMNVELYGSMFDIAGGDSTNGYFTDTSIHGVIPANKLTHISVSKHTKDNFDKDHYQSFYLNSWNLSRCDWVDFVNFKIEKGNKATDWSPAPEDTSAEIKSAKDDAINVASGKIDTSSKELRGEISSAKDSAENRAQELESRLNTTKNELQDIKAITQWHTVSGPIDLNDLKTQTRIFYRDIQDKNSAVTGWQYIVVDSSSDKVTQTVWKDNSTIQYIRQFTGAWSNWVRQTNQNDIDEAKTGLREEIKSAKDAAINVTKDNIEIKANELKTTYEETLKTKINEVKTASEKFTSDGIEQVVTKVSDVKNDVDRLGDTIDGIQIGGTNVLKNTDPDSLSNTFSDHKWKVDSGGNGHGALLDLGSELSAKHGFKIFGNTGGNKDFTQQPVHWNGGEYVFTVYIRLAPETEQTSVTALIRAWNNTKGEASYQNAIAITSKEWHKFSMKIDSSSFYKDDCGFSFGLTGVGSLNFAEPMLVTGTKAMDWSPAPEDINQQIANTNKKIDTQTLDSANIDEMKTQGHYFVKNLTGNPIGGWVYIDVTGNNNDRIRQDVYQDNGGKHMSRRLFGNSWSGWEQGAYISDVNNVKTEVTASVNNLGDRVITQVNSVETKINDIKVGGRNYLRDSDKSIFGWAQDLGTMPNATLNELAGKTITVSADVEWNNFKSDSALQNRLGFEASVTGSDGHGYWLGAWKYPKTSSGKERISTQYTLPAGVTFTVNNNGQNGYVSINGSGKVSHVKIEIGNKPTDWSPAPEDTAEAIKTLNTKWDVANGQIQGKVTATDVNNILNGKGYATQSWAQTQFQMKSDAITLQAVRDNITNGIQNQVNDAKSQINSANDRIDETNEKIDKAKIGERNLAVGTNRGKTGWTIDPGNGQSTMDDSWVNDAMGVVFNNSKKSTSWWVAQYPFDMSRLKPNTFYTISFDIQTDVKINGNGTVDFARGDSTGTPFIGSNGVKIITEPGGTTHVVHMAKTKGNIENNGQAFYLNSNSLGQANWVKIFNLMIVEGTQSIAWAAAPEDDDVKQKGVNLLKSSAYWSPGDWNIRLTDGSWVDDNWIDGLGHKAYGRKNGAWNGLGQTVYVTPGIYTWSAQIYVDYFADNDFVQVYMGDSQYNGTAQTVSIRIPQLRKSDSDKWVNYSATFFVKNAGNLCVRPELNNAHGEVHVGSQKLEHGMVATPWSPSPYDSDPQNIVSAINITPDQIKIASNKIVIDGNTDIHGTLRVPDVKLAGRNGNVDLSGDGINITKTNGAGINIASNGIQLTANTNGQNEVEGVLTTAWSMNNKNQNGIGLVITPEQTLGRPYGGDILTIGSMAAPGTIHAGMVFDATGINPDYRRGFNWFAPHTLSGDGGVLRFPGAQDDLMLYPGNMPGSRQSDCSQPTLRLVHGNSQGSAGIQFQWNDIVPFGRITSSMSYVSAVGTDDDGGITVSWYSYGAWYGGRKAPSIVYRGSDGNRGNGGIVFYPYGEVCFWQGDFHSNLRWSGMKNTD